MSSLSLSPSFNTFGELLRHLRRRARLTQRDLGLAVCYSEAHITRLEKGQRLPDLITVKALFIEALGLQHEPELVQCLIELAVKARSESTVPARQEFASPTASPPKRTNLLAQLTRFIGRERAIKDIQHLLGENRLVTLIGAGGVGKTRLAHQVAISVYDANTFADGVWWAELAALMDSALVPQTVAAALRLIQHSEHSLLDSIANHFAARPALLILDNCEHLIDACAGLAEPLLQRCPALRILATSRETLRIAGEVVYRVPSLTIPPLSNDPVDLNLYESVQLFVERARAVQPALRLTSSQATAVMQVCRRLDGIPLAIELAAAQLNRLTLEQIAARLNQDFQLLINHSRAVLPRHQTLKAALEWSYALLSASECTLFQQLSVFAGSFSLEAVEAICISTPAESDLQSIDPLTLLTQLTDKSLVVAMHDDQHMRYRLLEPIRQYAGEVLHTQGADQELALRSRHLSFYLALAEEGESQLTGVLVIGWLNQLEDAHDNFRTAIEWAFANAATEFGIRLVLALSNFWRKRGYHREEREQVLKALAKSDSAERTLLRARLLRLVASVEWNYKNYFKSRILCEEALSIGMELGDLRGIAESLLQSQYEAFSQKDFVTARRFNERALAAWRGLGDKVQIGHVLGLSADLARFRGDYEQAQQAYQEAISLLATVGETSFKALFLRRWARLELQRDDYEKAETMCQQSLELSWGVGERRATISALATFGGLAVAQGQNRRAAQLFGAMEALLQKLESPMLFGDLYNYQDDLTLLRAQLDEATISAAWAKGQAMPFEEAVAFAMRVPGKANS